MTNVEDSDRIKALPVQIISLDNEVHILRGSIEIRVKGNSAIEIIHAVLRAASEDYATRDSIINLFAAPYRETVDDLVTQLIKKGILISGENAEKLQMHPENNIDIFYWHFGENEEHIAERMNNYKILIIGVNYISKQMVMSLSESGFNNFELIDDPLMRNIRLYENDNLNKTLWPKELKSPILKKDWKNNEVYDNVDCIVATSDFGITPAISEWNEYCVKNKLKYLPIVLDRLIGYIGPLIVPGETACYECLRQRENSNMPDFVSQRASEPVAFDRQSINGFLPSMPSIIGNMGTLELTRFYSGIYQLNCNVGTLIEIRLLVPELITRKVLKLPRCPVCSNLKNQSVCNIYKDKFLLENPLVKFNHK